MKKLISSIPSLFIVALIGHFSIFSNIPGLVAQPDFQSLRAVDLRNNFVIPASPEAASLGKYGEVGISHYTGALDFSIPLATIGDKALNWSFGVRYDGGGVKPDDLPAQVGQNWSLDGVGVVTRSVQGFPDRDLNYYNAAKHWQTSPFEFLDLIHENYFLDSVARGTIETQPDLYHFNFGVFSGKFYIKPDKTIFFEDAVDLEIIPTFVTNAGNNNGDISSFQIRDAAGFIYTFEFPEKTTVTYQHVSAFTGTQDLTHVYNSAWYLKEVKHPNDGMGKLTFDYDVVTTSFTPVVNPWGLLSLTYTSGPLPEPWNCNQELCGNPLVPTYNSGWSPSAFPSITNRRFIKEASFFKGTTLIEKLTFSNVNNPCTYAYGGKQLSLLTRYTGPSAGTENTGWAFSYACRDGRLFLNSLNERKGVTATKPAYSFTYNTTTIPAPGSKDRDYWGYSNYNTLSGFIPTYKSACPGGTTYNGDGNRVPDAARMKAGILTQITYPTGGYTIIDYEGHQVPAYHDCQTLVGGLRVKEINNYAKSGVLAFKKQFKYTTGLTSSTTSGKLIHGFQITKSSIFRHYPISTQQCVTEGFDYQCTSVTIQTSPIITSQRVGGPHVGYSRVEEINNGKTVYHFKNIVGINTDNGDLLTKEIYDLADNLLEKTDYTYQSGTTGFMYSMAAEAKDEQDNKSLLCKSGANSYEWRLQCCAAGAGSTGCLQIATFQNKLQRKYTTIYTRKKLVTKEVFTYNSQPYTATQTSLIKQVEYQYNYTSAMLPTQIRTLDVSNNELSKQVMVYPSASNVPAAMLTKRMYSEPVEVIHYVNSAQIYGTKKLYPTTGNIHFTTTLQEKFASGSYANLYLITSFDATNGNVKSAKREFDVESSYLYSSDGARITAVANNAAANEIAFTSFDDTGVYQGGWTNLTTAHIKNLSNSGASGNGYYNPSAATYLVSPVLASGKYIVSYYSKNGTVTISNNSGTTTVHRNIYGTDNSHAGGWKYAEHIVTLSNSIRVNIPAGAFIDELRIYPADAQMKSFSYDKYTYLPQCISDVDGKTNRFEYDALNRFTTSRDINDHFLATNDYFYSNTSTYNAVFTRQIQTGGITTTSAAAALTGANVRRAYAYFDGLGRPDQNVTLDVSPTAYDLVNFVLYDTYGRAYREYLPYTVNGTGTAVNTAYRTSASTEQSGFYTTLGGNGFAESLLEVSPLSRGTGQKNPGAWNAFPTSAKYLFNSAGEVRNPKVAGAFYAANTLFKVENKDEDLKTLITYTDILGRKVMEDRGGAKTYYLYDNAGNITDVVQPEGAKLLHSNTSNIVTTPAVGKYCFLYTYNSRYLLYSKKIPGAQTYSLNYYDILDRPVLTIDPNGFKTFTKYDILSRPILTGKYNGASLPAPYPLFETKTTTGHFYTSIAFPANSYDVYTVQYYDDYDFDGNYTDNYTYSVPSGDAASYPAAAYTFVRGMSTGLKTGILNTSGAAPTVFVETYPFYDKKGRVIFNRASNPYAGADWEWTQYHFMGWVLKHRLQHTATLNSVSKNYIINQRYTYDHAGRLLNTYHKIGDAGTEVLLSENTYGERDELKKKRLASSQEVDYLYNIRMWLTDINDAAACTSADLFAMKLHYNTANANLSAAANYNGNISAIEWRVGANCQVSGVTRNKAAYGFTYDSQNRLTKSVYGEYNSSNTWQSTSLNRYTVDPIAYDDNGNITAITRKGWISGTTWNTIDQLTYSYSATHGNQLTAIAEASDLTRGFKKVSAGASGYVYDNNGNLTADGYRGITGITYNYLNLPAKITYSATKYIELTYDAAGRKWKKTAVDGATVTEKFYLGSLEYNGSNLEAIYHEEGRVIPIGAAFEYQYSIRDHLDNNRVMFKMVGSTATLIQESHFYPFGMEQDGNFVSGSDPHLYNGKELNEDFGLGWYDYGARWYDASIGRWNAVDPLAEKYLSFSPFNFVANNPILIYDADGQEIWIYYKEPQRNKDGEIKLNRKGETKMTIRSVKYVDGNTYDRDGKIVQLENKFVKNTVASLKFIQENGDDGGLVKRLQTPDVSVGINEISSIEYVSYDYKTKSIKYNEHSGLEFLTIDDKGMETIGRQSPATGLYHELLHAERHQIEGIDYRFQSEFNGQKVLDFSLMDAEEQIVTRKEGNFAKKKGENARVEYDYKNSTKTYQTKGPLTTQPEY